MKRFCTHCGKEIDENAVICVHCGCQVQPSNIQRKVEPDSDNIGWGFLGFFFPVIGLLLWLFWKDQAPIKAKKIGIGALVSAIISAVALIGYIIFIVVAASLASAEAGMVFEMVRTIL